MGFRAQLAPFLCLAASVAIAAGTSDAGDLLDRAESHARDSDEQWYTPELHRVRGETLRSRDPRAAEASFRRAVDCARAQGTRLWELRAAVSLATLWQSERKRAAARQLLDPVLEAFAGEADASDLAAARALRARLR